MNDQQHMQCDIYSIKVSQLKQLLDSKSNHAIQLLYEVPFRTNFWYKTYTRTELFIVPRLIYNENMQFKHCNRQIKNHIKMIGNLNVDNTYLLLLLQSQYDMLQKAMIEDSNINIETIQTSITTQEDNNGTCICVIS